MRRFAYRLALAMNRTDVDELLDELDLAQLFEWMAVYSIDPWDGLRSDSQFAMIAYMIAAASGGGKRVKIDDFMLWSRDDREGPGRHRADTPEKIWTLLTAIAERAHGNNR